MLKDNWMNERMAKLQFPFRGAPTNVVNSAKSKVAPGFAHGAKNSGTANAGKRAISSWAVGASAPILRNVTTNSTIDHSHCLLVMGRRRKRSWMTLQLSEYPSRL